MTQLIAISGAGPAGCSLALALLSGGVSADEILILDRSGTGEAMAGPDSRILAVNAGSRCFLEVLGLWPELAREAHPMQRIALSDSSLHQDIRTPILGFDPAVLGEPMAHLVPLSLLERTIRKAVIAHGIPVSRENLTGYAAEIDGIALHLGSDRKIARLLVGADGARSHVRRLANIAFHGWSYGQAAITGLVTHSAHHHGEAIQHFLPAGPFALLPLDEGRSSMVWSESETFARQVLAMSQAEQCEEIHRRAAGSRGEIISVGALSSHPLSLGLARRFIGTRLALLADAAHVVHPLAGQGLNLGFADAATLAEFIVDQARLGLDVGDPALLEAYQARRRPAAVAMATATDSLNRLFSNDLGPLRVLRDIGVGLVNRSAPLKSWLAVQAAGEMPNAPRLFRGESL